MSFTSAFQTAMASTGKPDRDALYEALKALVVSAPKQRGLTRAAILSHLLVYDPFIRALAARSTITFDAAGTPSVKTHPDDAMTLKEMKYGSSWFEGLPDVEMLLITKLWLEPRT